MCFYNCEFLYCMAEEDKVCLDILVQEKKENETNEKNEILKSALPEETEQRALLTE